MKIQFSLRTLFSWMTGSAVVCAAIVGLVAALGRGGATSFLIAFVTAGCAVWGGWYAEQRILGCPTSVRRVFTLTLVGMSVWLIALIQSAFWLEVPGAYGPVQYWDGDAERFMMLRGVALLVTAFGLVLAVAVSGFVFNAIADADSALSAWRQCIIPAVALAAYALSYWMFVAYGFFPSA